MTAGEGQHAGGRTTVLVVGAGPTGLLLAAELQRRGVPCDLIEAQSGPLHWDRATVVHPRSLEVFESMGLIDRFLAAGCKQRAVRIHSGGQELGVIDLSTCGSRYGFNLGLSEEITERILSDHLHRLGGDVQRSTRLVGLTLQPEGVVADIERNGARSQIEARWMVGCDGLHSRTRQWSGIGFVGHDIEEPWAVFDATLQGWSKSFEANFVYLETPSLILTALPERRWRAYIRPSSGEADFVAEAATVLRLYSPGVDVVDIENPTRFHCHSKVATRFREGPVFLAGDAAHVCSPDEGHGMNTGLQDAFNLAWKLALVHHGMAEETLLESYEAERRPVAEMISQSGDAFEQVLTMSNPQERELRDRTLQATLADPVARAPMVAAEAELNITYHPSPIVAGDSNEQVGPGERLPCVIALPPAMGHTLVLLGGPSADAKTFMHLHTALRAFAATCPWIEASITLEAAISERLGVDDTTLLVVRPDGHIGLRADREHRGALERYCHCIQGRALDWGA